MSEEMPVDLALLAKRQSKILNEVGTVGDDIGVMMAVLQRLDGTVSSLVNEIRATHAQTSRLAHRVSALEDAT